MPILLCHTHAKPPRMSLCIQSAVCFLCGADGFACPGQSVLPIGGCHMGACRCAARPPSQSAQPRQSVVQFLATFFYPRCPRARFGDSYQQWVCWFYSLVGSRLLGTYPKLAAKEGTTHRSFTPADCDGSAQEVHPHRLERLHPRASCPLLFQRAGLYQSACVELSWH